MSLVPVGNLRKTRLEPFLLTIRTNIRKETKFEEPPGETDLPVSSLKRQISDI